MGNNFVDSVAKIQFFLGLYKKITVPISFDWYN